MAQRTAALAGVERELARLPKGLREHVQRVRVLARELAGALGADAARVELAAAGHDLARAVAPDELLREAERLGIVPDAVEAAAPILLHGPVAAERLRREFGVRDAQVLQAVRCHTTAHPGLGLVGQVVFLADKLEPQKTAGRPALDGLLDLAARDPERAIAEYLTEELAVQLQRGLLLHPRAVEARNAFLRSGSVAGRVEGRRRTVSRKGAPSRSAGRG